MLIMKGLIITLNLVLAVAAYAESPIGAQAPSAAELKRACENYLRDKGYNTVSDMLCLWYVMPCACESTKEHLPRVCLPYNLGEEDAIATVLSGLEQKPELLEQEAAFAANSILSQHYPCQSN